MQLRKRNIDVVRCQEVGLEDASDFEHLAYASTQNRAIITHDQGFTGHHRIWLEQGKHHKGIFLITKDKENLGMIVMSLSFWNEALVAGAATLENDVYDRIIFLP